MNDVFGETVDSSINFEVLFEDCHQKSVSNLKEKIIATDLLITSYNSLKYKYENLEKNVETLSTVKQALQKNLREALAKQVSVNDLYKEEQNKLIALEKRCLAAEEEKDMLLSYNNQLDAKLTECKTNIDNKTLDYECLKMKYDEESNKYEKSTKQFNRQLASLETNLKTILQYVVIFGEKAQYKEKLSTEEVNILNKYKNQFSKSNRKNSIKNITPDVYEDVKEEVKSPYSCSSDSGISCILDDVKYYNSVSPPVRVVSDKIYNIPVKGNARNKVSEGLQHVTEKYFHNSNREKCLTSPTLPLHKSIGVDPILFKCDVSTCTTDILNEVEKISDEQIQSILKKVKSVPSISPIPWNDKFDKVTIQSDSKIDAKKHFRSKTTIRKYNRHAILINNMRRKILLLENKFNSILRFRQKKLNVRKTLSNECVTSTNKLSSQRKHRYCDTLSGSMKNSIIKKSNGKNKKNTSINVKKRKTSESSTIKALFGDSSDPDVSKPKKFKKTSKKGLLSENIKKSLVNEKMDSTCDNNSKNQIESPSSLVEKNEKSIPKVLQPRKLSNNSKSVNHSNMSCINLRKSRVSSKQILLRKMKCITATGHDRPLTKTAATNKKKLGDYTHDVNSLKCEIPQIEHINTIVKPNLSINEKKISNDNITVHIENTSIVSEENKSNAELAPKTIMEITTEKSKNLKNSSICKKSDSTFNNIMENQSKSSSLISNSKKRIPELLKIQKKTEALTLANYSTFSSVNLRKSRVSWEPILNTKTKHTVVTSHDQLSSNDVYDNSLRCENAPIENTSTIKFTSCNQPLISKNDESLIERDYSEPKSNEKPLTAEEKFPSNSTSDVNSSKCENHQIILTNMNCNPIIEPKLSNNEEKKSNNDDVSNTKSLSSSNELLARYNQETSVSNEITKFHDTNIKSFYIERSEKDDPQSIATESSENETIETHETLIVEIVPVPSENHNILPDLINEYISSKQKIKTNLTNSPETVRCVYNILTEYLTTTITVESLTMLCDKTQHYAEEVMVQAMVTFLEKGENGSGTMIHIPLLPKISYNQQACLCFMRKLNENPPVHYKMSIFNLFLDYVEYYFFNSETKVNKENLESLTKFYAVVCHATKQIDKLRLFSVNALYFLSFEALVIIDASLGVWPFLIPKASQSTAKDPIVFVLIYVITSFSQWTLENNYKYYYEHLQSTLINRYGYDISQYSKETVLKNLTENLHDLDNSSTNQISLKAAFILFGRKCGAEWCFKNVITDLCLSIMENPKISISIKSFTISLIGPLVKPFPCTMILQCEIIIKNLIQSLNCTGFPDVNEAIIETLLYFNKRNHSTIIEEIFKWRPLKPISTTLLKKLKMFVKEKPPGAWKTLRKKYNNYVEQAR